MRVFTGLLALVLLAGCRREPEIALIPPDFSEDGNPTVDPAAPRAPSDSFPVAEARFVHGHLRATHGQLRSEFQLPSTCELVDTLRTTLATMQGKIQFEAGTQQTEWFVTFGQAVPGQWKPGHYRVACKVGTQWTSASFELVPAPAAP